MPRVRMLAVGPVLQLALAVDEYDHNPDMISKELDLSKKQLIPFFKELGCTVGTSRIRLKVPLEFPKMKRSSGPRR